MFSLFHLFATNGGFWGRGREEARSHASQRLKSSDSGSVYLATSKHCQGCHVSQSFRRKLKHTCKTWSHIHHKSNFHTRHSITLSLSHTHSPFCSQDMFYATCAVVGHDPSSAAQRYSWHVVAQVGRIDACNNLS